jgi:hypothetical protein
MFCAADRHGSGVDMARGLLEMRREAVTQMDFGLGGYLYFLDECWVDE